VEDVNLALKCQLIGSSISKLGVGNRVTKDIISPPYPLGLGVDRQVCIQETERVTIAGPEHHTVNAEAHWLAVTVLSRVPDGEMATHG
jgi:hypothetical protein